MVSLGFAHQIKMGAGSNSMVEFPVTRTPPGWRRNCKNRVKFRILASENHVGEPDLSVTVNGLKMCNPFVIGSGPPGTNYTVMKRAFDEGWGAVIAKTVIHLITCLASLN